MVDSIKYSLLVLGLCLGIMQGYAQTTPSGYEDKLILFEELDFVLCNIEGKRFRATLENHSTDDFQDGTFEVDLGDGEQVHSKLKKGFSLDIKYEKKGPFNLKFSAKTIGGVTVSRIYKVVTLGKPEVVIKQKTTDVQCIGNDVIYIVDVYNQNSSKTNYTLSFDDGSESQVLTNDELKINKGEVIHKYEHSYCDSELGTGRDHFVVKLEAINECQYTNSATIQENVVIPIYAAFTFAAFDGENCTYEPIRLQNISRGGTDIHCDPTDIDWEWDFGNGETSTEFEPNITYEEAKDYKITLKGSNDYTCSSDTATLSALIISRVIADFEINIDTICAGTVLDFRNRTQGDKLRPYFWSVISLDGYSAPEIIGGSSVVHAQISFNHYGSYKVTLKVGNSCTNDQKDTIIVVQKDPHISKFELPTILCPPALEMKGKVDYDWNGNDVKPQWTVIRKSDKQVMDNVYTNQTNSTSEYPVFNLTDPDIYTIKLELTGVGCGGTILVKSEDIEVYDPEIDINVTTTPADLNICEGAQINFSSTSTGENLIHEWKYSNASISFVGSSNENSIDPTLDFKKYGDYTVSLHLNAACGPKDTIFNVHVRKESDIFHFDIPSYICPGDTIDFKNNMIYYFNGNPEKVTWTITPNIGLQYLKGTDSVTPCPIICFIQPAINYTLNVKVNEVGCDKIGVFLEKEDHIRVRASAMSLTEKARDTLVCEGLDIGFSMTASSAEDDRILFNWSVDPDDNHDFGLIGHNSAVANIAFNHWGVYDVRGEASGFCGVLDTIIQVRIKKDPEVRLKDTSGICPGVVDMQNYVTYDWGGNKEQVTWEVIPSLGTPSDGCELKEEESKLLYPKINFKSKGNYDLRVKLETVECSGTFLEVLQNYEVYDTTIIVDIEPNTTDICEGDQVRFRNMSIGVGPGVDGGLSYDWKISGPIGGWIYEEVTDSLHSKPVISFSKYGEYELKVNIDGTCNDKQETFHITVRGIPEIELKDKMTKICAGASVDMSEYITYTNRKNSTITSSWVVAPTIGCTFKPGFGADSDIPRIDFNDNDNYTLTLTASSQCGTPLVLSSTIDVIKNAINPSFTMPQEGCIPADILLENTSKGDSLSYTWSVISHTNSGEKGWAFQGADDSLTDSPRILFSEQGFYDIKLSVNNICGTQELTDTIRTYAKPEVNVRDIANVCETFHIAMADSVTVDINNDHLQRAKWTINPQPGYGDGFNDESIFPEISFTHGIYQVKAEFWNGCDAPGVGEFSIIVDEFIPIPPIPNDTLCHLEPLFLLKVDAKVEGGFWTLDEAEDLLVKQEGKDYFNPSFPGDYELTYNFRSGSCITSNTKKIKVHPLPIVEVGGAMEMCLNHAPRALNGLPSGGWWEGIEVVPPVFVPKQVGDTTLKYYFTDKNQCTNSDAVVMTVHGLPNTTFISKEQYCRGIEAEFETDLTAEKYIWAWGDKTVKDTTDTHGVHIYERHGYYDVQLIAVSEYNCVDTSGLQRIEIVNDAPQAKFSLDKQAACGPEVQLKITLDDPAVYSDHNLKFFWDFGNGDTSDTLFPHNPQIYYSRLWDTTYNISFKVYNMCNTTEMFDSIMVGSIPDAGLTFQHEWNCSPLTLRTKNISSGTDAIFIWDMGDGTELEYGYQPEDHMYLSDSASKVFIVTLIAKNTCGSDTVSKPLTVLAQTLEAFFEIPQNNVCVGEEICFNNVSTDTSLYVTYKYWDFGDNDNVRDTSWHACHVYQDSGWYKVLLYIDNGCGFDTISDRIHVWALPDVNIQSEDVRCDRDSFEFSFTSDQALQQWKWNLGDSTESLAERIKHRYNKAGDYTASIEIIVENIAFCKATYKKTVTVHPRPLIQFTPKDTLFCPPYTYIPRVMGGAPIMMWDYGDGSEQTSALEHIYENDTDSVLHYQIVLHSESDKGCPEDFMADIAVAYLPIAGMEKKVTQGRPQKVELINTSKDHTECIWYLLDGEVNNTLDNRHLEFMENGQYELSLVAYSQYACKDSISIEHEVSLRGLYFPNTFIPHSLNGQISEFKGIGMGLQYYKCSIYDQYRNKLWETQALENGKPSEGWNGTNLQGDEMPQGIYVWRAEAIFENADVWTGDNNMSGNIETVQGQILLLRK